MKDKYMLQIFERRILKRFHGQIKGNGTGRARDNHELYKLHNVSEAMKMIKVWRLRWLEELLRLQK
jgi:hypothetical protein